MQRDDGAAGANDEITVDVIAVDDHEKDHVSDSKPEEIRAGQYIRTNACTVKLHFVVFFICYSVCKAVADDTPQLLQILSYRLSTQSESEFDMSPYRIYNQGRF